MVVLCHISDPWCHIMYFIAPTYLYDLTRSTMQCNYTASCHRQICLSYHLLSRPLLHECWLSDFSLHPSKLCYSLQLIYPIVFAHWQYVFLIFTRRRKVHKYWYNLSTFSVIIITFVDDSRQCLQKTRGNIYGMMEE